MRLVGGVRDSSSGLLEVCANGYWGRVCDYQQQWSIKNADVVCKQLNYSATGVLSFSDKGIIFLYIGAKNLHLEQSIFDLSSNSPVILGNVHCTGTEEMLLDCSHSSIGTHLCDQLFDMSPEPPKVSIKCEGVYVVCLFM